MPGTEPGPQGECGEASRPWLNEEDVLPWVSTPRAAPILLPGSMRTPIRISFSHGFRFLEGVQRNLKRRTSMFGHIDLFWFRLADFHIKTKNKVSLQGWFELITLEPVPP